MNRSENQKILKYAKVVLVVFFVFTSIFGLFLYMGNMNSDGTMSGGCMFNGQMELCTMNFSDHIGLWQDMFLFLPSFSSLSLMVFATLLLLFVSIIKPYQDQLFRMRNRLFFYTKKVGCLNLSEPLRIAFSRGILNTKVF